MTQKLKKGVSWIGLRAPYIAVIILLIIFAINGSVSINNEEIYQCAAGIIALMQMLSLLAPRYNKFLLITDLLSISWFMMWGWEVYDNLYPNRAGLFAVVTYPTIGIFLAFASPIRTRIYKPKFRFKRTPNYGENLTPHFSNVRRRPK